MAHMMSPTANGFRQEVMSCRGRHFTYYRGNCTLHAAWTKHL